MTAAHFVRREDGGGTVMSLFVVIILAMLLGIALDATNGWRNRTYLSSAADMGAHAGAVAIAQGVADADVAVEVRRVVEANLPTDSWGNVIDIDTDVTLLEYDTRVGSFVNTGGSKNAVMVHLERTEARGNPIQTFLLRFVGLDTMDVQALSAGVFDVSGICNATDGIFAQGRVRISSQADVGGGICLHSQDHVWLPQQNTFQPDSFVTMPDLALCEDKCQEDANPGIVAFETNMVLPDFGEFITNAHDNFQLGLTASSIKNDFFTDDPEDPFDAVVTLGDLTEMIDANVITGQTASVLEVGDVIDLTHTEFHALSQLPSGLVYRVDCPNSGNGPTTRLRFDDATGAMEDAVLLTDCSLDFDDGSRIAGSVVITMRQSSTATISAGSSTEIGDPTQSCTKADRSVIMAMSPVSVPAEFTMSNVTLIVDNNVDVASSTSSGQTSYGFAIYASGAVDVASQHTFRSCGLDGDTLTPVGKVLRLVIPPSVQHVASLN